MRFYYVCSHVVLTPQGVYIKQRGTILLFSVALPLDIMVEVSSKHTRGQVRERNTQSV